MPTAPTTPQTHPLAVRLTLDLLVEHHVELKDSSGLITPDFDDSLATISLAPHIAAGFRMGPAHLSFIGLSHYGRTVHKAWNHAANNMIEAAHNNRGLCFEHRPSTTFTGDSEAEGIQVRVAHSAISSWLAHPRTFNILDNHFRTKLGSSLTYFAPRPGLLFISPHQTKNNNLQKWLFRTFDNDSAQPLFYNSGFPTLT